MKAHIESVAKYAGLATVAVEWSALLVYYLKMPVYFGGKYPISYFASVPETRWAFTICYVLAAICFWIFVKHHLAKYYRIPLRIFGVSLALFAGVGLFPYDPSDPTSSIVHSFLALSSGLLFITGMLLIAKYTNDKVLSTITLLSAAVSFGFTVIFLFLPKDSDFIFLLEAGSWLVLQLWTIWITLHARKYVQKQHDSFH